MLEAAGGSHLPRIFSKAKTEADIMKVLLALDISLKASPQLLPAVRALVSTTTLPSCCQSLLKHWVDVRFLPRMHVPSPGYGYFFWKKTFRQAKTDGDIRRKHDNGGNAIPVDGARQECCHCNDLLAVSFCNDLNQWTYVDAWQLADSTLLHKQCVDLSRLANILTTRVT